MKKLLFAILLVPTLALAQKTPHTKNPITLLKFTNLFLRIDNASCSKENLLNNSYPVINKIMNIEKNKFCPGNK